MASFCCAGIGVMKYCSRDRCPSLETGRNSVKPWTTPRTQASQSDSAACVSTTPLLPGAVLLHLHNEGEDDGASVEALEIAPEGTPDLFLHLDRICARFGI